MLNYRALKSTKRLTSIKNEKSGNREAQIRSRFRKREKSRRAVHQPKCIAEKKRYRNIIQSDDRKYDALEDWNERQE